MATQTLNTRIALKSDTTANWAKSTLVLLKGEQAIEITESGAYKIKIGDGVTSVMNLKFLADEVGSTVTIKTWTSADV